MQLLSPFSPLRQVDPPEWFVKVKNKFNLNRKNPIEIVDITSSPVKLQGAIRRCFHAFIQLSSLHQKRAPSLEFKTRPLMGRVFLVPEEFGFWMRGISYLAAYLSKKNGLQGLFVCETLEAFSGKLQEIAKDPTDQRAVLIVGAVQSDIKNYVLEEIPPNFPQHKVAVCLEKKGSDLSIAILDSQPVGPNKYIRPDHLPFETSIWEGLDGYGSGLNFTPQELISRAVLKADLDSCSTRLFYNQVERQKSYGCDTFALRDAIAFLRDPDFFQTIKSDGNRIFLRNAIALEAIVHLPPQFMIGTQSLKLLKAYFSHLSYSFFDMVQRVRLLKKLTLNHIHLVDGKAQNLYIAKKNFKYFHLLLAALESLSPQELAEMEKTTLVRS